MLKTDAIRRTIRTIVQTAVASSAVLLVIVPVTLEAASGIVSPSVYATLAAGAAVLTGLAGLVSRIMAMPAVVKLIELYAPWLSATASKSDPDTEDEPTA